MSQQRVDHQASQARLLIVSLAEAGVRDVVISPGSRSTPFVLAALAQARRDQGRLDICEIVDERSAAFFALGRARITGRPSLLLCTSGTAGANYMPAVVEAAASGVPLLVLTADRPFDLQGCGANQTIDQQKLFGGFARRYVELGEAHAGRSASALRRTVAQAFYATLHPEPGPVHLNVRAHKPLEPAAAVEAVGGERPLPRLEVPRRVPSDDVVDELADACRRAERGLLVAGPAPVAQGALRQSFLDVARRAGLVVLADAASQLRFWREHRGGERRGVVAADTYPFLLADAGFRAAHPADLVVQVGRAPTTTAWERYLAEHPPAHHWVLGSFGWQDPASTATRLVAADARETLYLLAERLDEPAADAVSVDPVENPWRRAWHRACLRDVLSEVLGAGSDLSEGLVPRLVVDALPDGGLLVVGNSLPIRELDAWVPGTGEKALRVVSQRGVSGIDGLVSGAFGAAGAASAPGALLVGDVSFLHDLSGLAAAHRVEAPFAVVVINNGGGRIFEQLPVASYLEREGMAGELDLWTTPHQADLASAAAVYGLPHRRVKRRDELAAVLEEALDRAGVTVIEAVVPPQGAAEQNARVASRIVRSC